jgi:hypothetical protein
MTRHAVTSRRLREIRDQILRYVRARRASVVRAE